VGIIGTRRIKMSILEKFDFEKVAMIIQVRIFEKIDETLSCHADIILYEVQQEFKRILKVNVPFSDYESAINILFDLKQVNYNIKIGNKKFDMRECVLDLLYDK